MSPRAQPAVSKVEPSRDLPVLLALRSTIISGEAASKACGEQS